MATFSGTGGTPGAPQQPTSGAHVLNNDHAILFSKSMALAYEVSRRFEGTQEMFAIFYNLVESHRNGLIDTDTMMQRVSECLVGHNDVLEAFKELIGIEYPALSGREANSYYTDTVEDVAITMDGYQGEDRATSEDEEVDQLESDAGNKQENKNIARSDNPEPLMNRWHSIDVRDAKDYVMTIKLRFSSNPETFTEFRRIMNAYQTRSITTVGVMERIYHLFQGHPDLLVRFNAFVPLG